KLQIDMDKAIDMSKSLNEGAILLPEYKVGNWEMNMIAETGDFDFDKKLSDYSKEELDELLYSKARKVKVQISGNSMNMTVEGILEKFTNKYIKQDLKTKSERTQKAVAPFITEGPCPSCHGARLSQPALNCKINNYNIADLASMEVDQLIQVIEEIKQPEAAPMVKAISERLQLLVDIGLEYLNLDRETDTLSGGESQRVKMVKHLSGRIGGVVDNIVESSIGLHSMDY